MAIVSTFPHPPEVLMYMVDALAEADGEPKVASFDTAAKNCSAVVEMADTWTSLENHIYKGRLATTQYPYQTALVSQ